MIIPYFIYDDDQEIRLIYSDGRFNKVGNFDEASILWTKNPVGRKMTSQELRDFAELLIEDANRMEKENDR